MIAQDTIIAAATPPGRGAVSIIRISGSLAFEIAKNLTNMTLLPRHATYCPLIFHNEPIDIGIWLFFPGPNSYTGEDVVEFQGHGGPIVIQTIVSIIQEFGARPAKPGEFSERAFLNNKIDLTQAEAISDLINASSKQAVKAANKSLLGSFGQKINSLVSVLIELRTHLEAHIDFPDEDIEPKTLTYLQTTLESAQKLIIQIIERAETGAKLNLTPHVVLVGAPNSGKSSLLNAIAQESLAIVTNVPGTTRDLIHQNIILDGYEIKLTDTAGIRYSDDVIEKEGVRRALVAVDSCDFIIMLFDEKYIEIKTSDIEKLIGKIPNKPILLVRNKIDLLPSKATTSTDYTLAEISAKTGKNLKHITNWLLDKIKLTNDDESVFLARERHLSHLKTAKKYISNATKHAISHESLDLIAEDLRLTQYELSSITGKFTSDDLLSSIFSTFCIGK